MTFDETESTDWPKGLGLSTCARSRVQRCEDLGRCECRSCCGEQCYNRICHYICDDETCSAGPECGNRLGVATWSSHIYVSKTEHCGSGLFTRTPMPPDEIFVEYTGKLITRQEIQDTTVSSSRSSLSQSTLTIASISSSTRMDCSSTAAKAVQPGILTILVSRTVKR